MVLQVVGALSVFWLFASGLNAMVLQQKHGSSHPHHYQQQSKRILVAQQAPRLTALSTVASEPLPGHGDAPQPRAHVIM